MSLGRAIHHHHHHFSDEAVVSRFPIGYVPSRVLEEYLRISSKVRNEPCALVEPRTACSASTDIGLVAV